MYNETGCKKLSCAVLDSALKDIFSKNIHSKNSIFREKALDLAGKSYRFLKSSRSDLWFFGACVDKEYFIDKVVKKIKDENIPIKI